MFKQLEIRNLSFQYADHRVLDNVSLKINRSEIVLVNGISGSGKTTLLKLIGSQLSDKKASNSLYLNGESYSEYSNQEIKKTIAVVNQEADLQLCRITVYDEITFGLENKGFTEEDIKQRANQFLEMAGLSEKKDLNCKFLSGGEKQKLIISSILAMGKSVILLDEPLAHLDTSSRRELINFIKKMKIDGVTFLIIEHRVIGLSEIADQKFSILNGKLCEMDLSTEMIAKPKLRKTEELVLELKKISYVVNKNKLLNNISLSVKRGEVIGIFGANGSGKSTLLQCIKSLLPYDGSINCNARISILFQNPDFSLIERTVLKTVNNQMLLKEAGLEFEEENHPLCLSKGQRLRLSFLNILQYKPEILLLDEITSGQDPHHIKSIINLLNYEELIAVIIVSHDINILESISDHIYELKNSELNLLK